MKNFKKSLLVVPALGVLMLAAAGSVGGTVAWFSSVNTFSTNVSSFSVGRVTGNLDVTMTAIAAKGTVQAGNGVAVGHEAAGDVKMTHGSFNHGVAIGTTSVYTITNQAISLVPTTNQQQPHTTFDGTVTIDRSKFLYASKQIEGTYKFTSNADGSSWNLASDGGKVSAVNGISAETLTSSWGLTLSKAGTNGQVIEISLDNTYDDDDDWMYSTSKITTGESQAFWFYAVSWSMEFTYEFGSDTTHRNVYFDTTSSISRTTDTNGTTDEETWKGFRIAFKVRDASRCVIWAPQQNAVANIHYVNSTSAIADYAADENTSLLNPEGGNAPANCVANTATAGGIAAAAANRNYLFQLQKPNNATTASQTIDCVAWFEGSDPNVINSADLDTVAAALSFFAVPHAA